MLSLFKGIDMFGIKISIKSNERKDSYPTIFGAIISILLFISSFAIGMYFFFVFSNRSSSTIISATKSSPNVQIKSFQNFPFMMRLSLSGAVLIPEEEQIWRLAPYLYTKNTAISSQYNTTLLPYKRCDINQFKGFEFLLANRTDINTYFCIDYKNNIFDLYGKYGDSSSHNFLDILIRGCYDSNGDGPCKPPPKIQSTLASVYLEILTVNAVLDHSKVDPVTYELVSDRIPLYFAMTKRIYYYFKSIYYTSDFGYIFEELSSFHINQFPQYVSDTALATYTDPANKSNYGNIWGTLCNKQY